MGLDTRMIPGAVPACSSTRLTHATITNQTSSHFAEALMAGPATLRPPPLCAPRWHKMLAVAVLLAAAGCSGAADTPSSPRSTRPSPAPTGTAATVPAFARGRFAAVIPVPGATRMTVADGMLWVHKGASTVVRVDPATSRVVGTPLRVPADAEAIAVGQGALWVASVAPGDIGSTGMDQVTRIDLATGRTVAAITVGRAPWTWRPRRGRCGCPTPAAAATA
jgi:hypothetical protein